MIRDKRLVTRGNGHGIRDKGQVTRIEDKGLGIRDK